MTIPSSEMQSAWTQKWPFKDIVGNLPEQGKLIEIGPYLGKSTVSWAEEFKEANKQWLIHTVDIFAGLSGKHWPEEVSQETIEFLNTLIISEADHLSTFKRNIEGWDNITWEKKFFTKNYKPKDDYDVLFYDGLHEYLPCLEALNFWKDKVSWMIIDDYGSEFEGTDRAVDEVVEQGGFELEKMPIEIKPMAIIRT